MAARMSAQAVTLPKIWLRSMTIETYQQIDAEQVVANVQSGAVAGSVLLTRSPGQPALPVMRTEPAAPSVEWIMTLFCARTRSRRWASEVAERGGGPHPLAAPDLTSRTPVDVCKGCYQEPDLHGARQRDAPFLSGAQVAPLLSCHARTSCVRFQLYGEADKVFLSSLKQLADQDHSEFPLRGAQRIIVAYGCSRLRGGLRGRRPCGHAASARARGGSVRTGRGRRPERAAGTADRPLELLEPGSDPLRPVLRRKLEESQGCTDARRAHRTVHPAPVALDRRVRLHIRGVEHRIRRLAAGLGPFGRASGERNVRGRH